MSGGVLVVRQPVAQLIVRSQAPSAAPVVLVAKQEAAKLVSVAAQGPAGRDGDTVGFGQATYTERTVEPEDVFAAGVRQQLVFVPTTVQDYLNPPFVGHVFWSGNRVQPRAVGDLYDVQVNLIVTATIAGGQLRMDADVGSQLGPVASDTQTLFNGANVSERVTFRLRVQVLANFLANGCALYLTSSVPLTVTSEAVLVAPASVYAP